VRIDEPDRTDQRGGNAARSPESHAGGEARPRPPARRQKDERPGEHVQAALFEDLFRRTP
jgi:hypothetical protein